MYSLFGLIIAKFPNLSDRYGSVAGRFSKDEYHNRQIISETPFIISLCLYRLKKNVEGGVSSKDKNGQIWTRFAIQKAIHIDRSVAQYATKSLIIWTISNMINV
jgi:hypothetical protein